MLAIRGLYAITPDTMDQGDLLARAALALEGGAQTLQYRSKSPDEMLKRDQARGLAALCRRHRAVFIVNDDVELAAEVNADGVHLGREDTAIAAARAQLGPRAVIGASCYDDLESASTAVDAGADYLAFGSFFPSSVKPCAARPSLDVLRQARRRWSLPLVAIGGITADNAGQVIAAGADAVAVITAVFLAPDTRAAARAIARLFEADARRENLSPTQ